MLVEHTELLSATLGPKTLYQKCCGLGQWGEGEAQVL